MAAFASRMAKELKKLEKQPPPGISVVPVGGSIKELKVQLQGPPDSPYELGLFQLSITVPDRYPFEPPKVQFMTPVYHPNIDAQGRICLDYLNMPPKGSWGPAMDLYKVLVAIRQLLSEPNPRDPLEATIAEEYVSQPEVFKAKARRQVNQHATANAAASSKQTKRSNSTDAAGERNVQCSAHQQHKSVDQSQQQQVQQQQDGNAASNRSDGSPA